MSSLDSIFYHFPLDEIALYQIPKCLTTETLDSIIPRVSRCSSVVEQRFCKPPVVGSSPTIGSFYLEAYTTPFSFFHSPKNLSVFCS
jgi:hypothetical protein